MKPHTITVTMAGPVAVVPLVCGRRPSIADAAYAATSADGKRYARSESVSAPVTMRICSTIGHAYARMTYVASSVPVDPTAGIAAEGPASRNCIAYADLLSGNVVSPVKFVANFASASLLFPLVVDVIDEMHPERVCNVYPVALSDPNFSPDTAEAGYHPIVSISEGDNTGYQLDVANDSEPRAPGVHP